MVNIVKFEYKNNIASLMGWIVFATIISIVYLSVFPSFESSSIDLEKLLSSYPKEMLSSLNINIEYISKMEGYYPMVIGFVQIIAFAFSSTITLKIFCKEYKNKSVEFILSKPRSRNTFYVAKIIAVILLIITFYLFVFILNLIIIRLISNMSINNYIIEHSSVLIVMMLASSMTSVIAVIFSKIRGYDGFGFIIAFGFYFLNIISSIFNDGVLAKLSIYGLFDYNNLLINGYSLKFIIHIILLTLIFNVISNMIYSKKYVL
ncbi:MAG: ABC transporter permease subunit [Bacilli bacterium]